jgi:hypothetical protein
MYLATRHYAEYSCKLIKIRLLLTNGGLMENKKAIIKNLIQICLLDMVLFPAGFFLYMFYGFHLFHAILAVGFLYGIKLVLETADLLVKEIAPEVLEENFDDCCGDCESCECEDSQGLMKPEFKKAMDEAFGLKTDKKERL